MTVPIKISSKGQVVIPKDIRDALRLRAGGTLQVSLQGNRIVMEPSAPAREQISYEEFRRRVPRHEGVPATIEDMNIAVDRMFAERGRP
jgi:AbrB family looped-hinge helix DNA binding protein